MAWGKKESYVNGQMLDAVLGKDTRFEGTLETERGVRIDGHYKGLIKVAGDVVVGEDGVVEAQVYGHNVQIDGEVHGQVYATGLLELTATGKLYGDLQAAKMHMEEGAVFDGRCNALTDKAESAGKVYSDPSEFTLTAIASTKSHKSHTRRKESTAVASG
jgi:cytoskeletal protein CcmA (bactofilin family)